jgi:predicted double-glycine peptidase
LISRAIHLLGTVAVILAATVLVPEAHAQTPAAQVHLLDVPYLPQSEALCGGAAIAMVMRYFGATNVYAETFSSLVDQSAGGIHGQDLIDALETRGWLARSFRGDASLVQSHLAASQPAVALIQDRPGRFHYVVIVGWSGGRVIVHDPARAPFRLLDEKQFTDAWAQSGYWTLVAAPPARSAATDTVTEPHTPARRVAGGIDAPCGGMVDEGVRLSGTGQLDEARRLLELAAAECPASVAPWRELAGIHALKSEWRDAAGDARRALVHDPGDPLASRILATALYLDDDPDGALAAWNNVGEPVIDLVNITGLERTRYLVAARAMALHPKDELTPASLRAARRRLAELPSAQTTRLSYRPGENGRAQVDAVVLERPLFPTGVISLAAAALRMGTDRELAGAIASPSGGGELWTASWRWWAHRPRVAAGLAAPAPFGGVWRVEGSGERQTYATGAALTEETDRRVAFQASDWTQLGVRWAVTAAVDSWSTAGRSFSLGLSGEQRLLADRLTVRAGAAAWRGGVHTWTLGLGTEWRSAVRNEGNVWLVRGGADEAGDGAPLALWSGAGTGQGRDVLLRAHPLLHDGIIRDGVFGRRTVHGGTEWRRWTEPHGKPIRFAPAIFVDAARAAGVLPGGDPRAHVDAGAGLRIALPGAGIVRIDFAHGLRDGKSALSIGWTK